MGEYQSNLTLPEAARLIEQSRRVVVVTHAKPDGDAIGSVIALSATLRRIGRPVHAWLIGPVSAYLRTLRGADWADDFGPACTLASDDLLVIVDTGAFSQLAPMRRLIQAHLPRTLVIDHHLSGDVEAAWRYIDGRAAACCEVIAQLIDELVGVQDKMDPVVADALFVGIASDTGWFRFSNTTARTHELAARLLRAGVNHDLLYQRLEQTERPEKLALLHRALSSMEWLAGGKAAVMVLRASDFADTGALLEETERFVDVPQVVADTRLVILVTEPPPEVAPATTNPRRRTEDKLPGAIRLSFRSKPGPDAVNVAELAGRFGGGGHARASGAKVAAPLDQVLDQVRKAASEALNNS